jgi:hypothetical protein
MVRGGIGIRKDRVGVEIADVDVGGGIIDLVFLQEELA